ncbi:MAG: SurA N-terminal domain-containing protein [Chromatiales bacterium]|nr:SurA N-terminal domain-containing protein [Chromatiales bacterium]
MLTKIRDKATGWIAYAIVIVISIPFALWGIQQYFGLDSSPTAIAIDDQEISEFQFEQAVIEKRRQLEQTQANVRFDEDEIKDSVVSEIVSQQLMILAINKYNLQATDGDLAEFIRNRPEFRQNQSFDANLYRDLLARSGYSVTDYERIQREDLKKELFIDMLQSSSFVLPSERERYIQLADQSRKIRYLTMNYSYFVEPDSIDTDQAQAHYDANMELYQSPYKARFDYLEISMDKLEAEEIVTPDEARQYYEERAGDYLYPEKFDLRHILISTDERSADEARSQADELYLELLEGADFADLARTYSDDILTAESGGILPELTADELDNDEVRDAVLQLAEGEYTNPISTQYGIQIFELLKLTEAEQKPFKKVRKELISDIKYQRASIRYAGLIERLDLLLFEDEPGFFSTVRANLGYEKQSTGFIDLNKQESILADPSIRATVISEIIQGGRTNTGLIEVEPGRRAFFVGITGTQPSVQLSFEDALQDVITNLILQQAYNKIRENTAQWIQEIQAGNTDLDTLATENRWTVEDPGYIKRNETSIPRPIVEKSFSALPSSELPLYQSLQMDFNYNNDHALIELLDIQAGKETSQTTVIYSLKNREAVALLESLQDFHDVEINVGKDEDEEEENESTETSNEEETDESVNTEEDSETDTVEDESTQQRNASSDR